MTPQEAWESETWRLTTKPWNPYASLILVTPTLGLIVDPCGNLGMGHLPDTRTPVPIDPTQDIWEKWNLPDDFARFLTIQ